MLRFCLTVCIHLWWHFSMFSFEDVLDGFWVIDCELYNTMTMSRCWVFVSEFVSTCDDIFFGKWEVIPNKLSIVLVISVWSEFGVSRNRVLGKYIGQVQHDCSRFVFSRFESINDPYSSILLWGTAVRVVRCISPVVPCVRGSQWRM